MSKATVDNLVRIWLPLLVLVVSVTGTGLGTAMYFGRRLEAFESRIEDLWTNRFTRDMALRAAIENPGMGIPDPYDFNKIIRVEIKEP